MDKYKKPLQLLGQGAFGKVYKAESIVDGKTYALKCVTVDRKQSAELIMEEITIIMKEIKNLTQVGSHPNIMQYMENFIGDSPENTAGFSVWLVLEFCNGGTLDSFIFSNNLDRGTILQLLRDMADGVAYLHGRNIVHRDLKPDNILVDNSGPQPIVKIADFGLARVCGESKIGGFDINRYYMDTFAGTKCYMPPEMLRQCLENDSVFLGNKTQYEYAFNHDGKGKYTAKSDVWAMGIIIAAVLGRMIDPSTRNGKLLPILVVEGQFMLVAEAIIKYRGFTLADKLMTSERPGSEIKALVLSMLAKDPHKRPTAGQILGRLKEITNTYCMTNGKSSEPGYEDSGISTRDLPVKLPPIDPPKPSSHRRKKKKKRKKRVSDE